jgi:hypothetical protein
MTNLDGVYICMFCGRADHLDKFCFQRKRIEKRRFDYARNSYRDEFIDFLPRSYSHAPPRFYSRASPHTSSCALPQFAHGPNHHSYGFGSQENRFVLIVVIVSRVGLVSMLEGLTLTFSRDIWTAHVFPIVVHVSLSQMVSCKGL